MKLRIRDNSLRLRLTVPEVDAIADHRTVTASVTFPGGHALTYALRPDGTCQELEASFDPLRGRMEIRLPAAAGREWQADPQAISLRARLLLAGGDTLQLLVEKDFACLDPRLDEDQADAFARPQAIG